MCCKLRHVIVIRFASATPDHIGLFAQGMIVAAIGKKRITNFLEHVEAQNFQAVFSVLLLDLISDRRQLEHDKVFEIAHLLQSLVIFTLAFL